VTLAGVLGSLLLLALMVFSYRDRTAGVRARLVRR
jgi:hypothetical protein